MPVGQTLSLREQGCEDQWLFFEAKKSPRAKMLGKYWISLNYLHIPLRLAQGADALQEVSTMMLRDHSWNFVSRSMTFRF